MKRGTVPGTIFIAKVEEIACEEPSYRIGGTGTDGTCDCIGLIVGAIRRAGGVWNGRKGSNYAARNEITSLLPIASNAELAIGEAVFKAREPGEAGYDAEVIRKNYSGSADQRDYYHIGVVESVYPLRIRHMTTPRVQMDTGLGKWKYHGWLKKIRRDEEGGENTTMETAMIYGGAMGSPINARSSGSLQSPILFTIPQQSEVEVIEEGEKWSRVQYGGRSGYVQNVFVHKSEQEGADLCSIPREKIERIYDEIGDWLGLRG